MTKITRTILLIVLLGLSAVALYPTVMWYLFTSEQEQSLAQSTRTEVRRWSESKAQKDQEEILSILAGETTDPFLTREKLNPSFEFVYKEAQRLASIADISLGKNAKAEDIFAVFENRRQVFDVLLDYYARDIAKLEKRKNSIITLGLDLRGGVSATLRANTASLAERLEKDESNLTAQEISDAIDRALVVLRSRIDTFGVSEPVIRRQDDVSILVEVPGQSDRSKINSFILGKGTISFVLVNDRATESLLALQRQDFAWEYNELDIPDFIPEDSQIIEYVTKDSFDLDVHQNWIAIYKDLDTKGLDGSFLREARIGSDPTTGEPTVNFILSGEGAQKFALLTSENVNRSLAIVQDGKVRAYATITQEIRGGEALIRGFSISEAEDIALVLSTAALPVDLEIINQQSIGPRLSSATIDAGIAAIIYGFIAVVAFIVVYYLGAGLVSVITLAFNMLFLMAILSTFNFTMTLTGIAGIVLIVGMAVDSNVLIFERIKEELLLNKSRRVAIDTGFKKAFWAILDSNVTTLIAAFFISQIASGPVQGFAVTLSTGIVTTLISTLFLSRLLFDYMSDWFSMKRVYISWWVKG